MPRKATPPETRFWAKVDRDGPLPKWAPFLGPCWLWTAYTSRGYGQFRVGEKQVRAHRFSYKLNIGPIPEGLELDHLCRVPACVRPDHLEPVTTKENVRRSFNPPADNARKTKCIRGHEFTPENTYTSRDGWRQCRTCLTDQRAKQKAAGLPDGDPRHGTNKGYTHWGCRCDPCKAANAAYRRDRNLRLGK